MNEPKRYTPRTYELRAMVESERGEYIRAYDPALLEMKRKAEAWDWLAELAERQSTMTRIGLYSRDHGAAIMLPDGEVITAPDLLTAIERAMKESK